MSTDRPATAPLSTPVAQYLRGLKTWERASGSARVAFCLDMSGRAYGPNETHDAWGWFYSGWRAHEFGPK